MKPHVLISGGTGLIGSHLAALLTSRGYPISLLSRQQRSLTGIDIIRWDPEHQTIEDFDIPGDLAIINLAGENLTASRWNQQQKEKITKSRTDSLKLINRIVEEKRGQVKRVISTSAIGYYGTFTSKQIFDEESHSGNDFLARTCLEWENAVMHIAETGVSASWIRTGVVLSKEGGALQAILGSTRSGFAIPLGTGRQWVPWIHIRDLVRMFEYLLDHTELNGVYNGVAPAEDQNRDLMKTIARVKKKIYLPFGIPSFLIKSLLGEMSSISLYGSRITAQKIIDTGFEFNYINLEDAIRSFEPRKKVDR